MRYTFSRHERLKSKEILASLFKKGSHFVSAPIHVRYTVQASSEKGSVQVAFSVPKRRFKRAVDRNRVKRLIREAYRLNKHDLLNECISKSADLRIIFIYSSDHIPSYSQVESSVKTILASLAKNLD